MWNFIYRVMNKNIAEKNGMWKGNSVGYDALHEWLRKRIKKPILCERWKKFRELKIRNSE